MPARGWHGIACRVEARYPAVSPEGSKVRRSHWNCEAIPFLFPSPSTGNRSFVSGKPGRRFTGTRHGCDRIRTPVSECSRMESEFNIPEKVRKTVYRGSGRWGRTGERRRRSMTRNFYFPTRRKNFVDLSPLWHSDRHRSVRGFNNLNGLLKLCWK